MNPALHRLRPFGLCLLAAVLLHSLALTLLQLQRQRSKPATASALSGAMPADDTPELLRFSRHQAEVGPPSIVPLPGFDQLPPPPPMAASAPSPGANAKPKGPSDFKLSKFAADGRAGSASKAGQELHRRTSQARHGSSGSGGPSGLNAEVDTPAALMERLRRLASEPPEARSGTEPAPGANPAGRSESRRGNDVSGRGVGEAEPQLRRPEGSAQQPYLALWESARPEAGAPAGMPPLPATLERRSLPLQQARRGGLPINHGEGVLLGDQLLLFWIQGDQLWLLRGRSVA